MYIEFNGYDSGFIEMNKIDFAFLAGGELLWFNQTTLLNLCDPSFPVPQVAFTYGTTYIVNGTDSYLYHQIDDSTLAEEHWDNSPFWLPSRNISINTT